MANKAVISIGDGGIRAIYTNVPDLVVYTVDADWDDGSVINGPFGVGPLEGLSELAEELDAEDVSALSDPDNRENFRVE